MLHQKFENYANIYWIEDYKAVRVEWYNLYMQLEKFQEIYHAGIDLLLDKKGTVWIADQYQSKGVFSKDVQTYIVSQLAPEHIPKGLDTLITIEPKALGFSTHSMKKWTKEVEQSGPFTTGKFPTLEDCEAWLQERKAQASS